MNFRARYYDAGTGEFISRDPLEYVDGMSLYRAYFVPNGVDPEGTDWVWPWDPKAAWWLGNEASNCLPGVRERNGKVCGYSVWLLTGSCCACPDILAAATDEHDRYTGCYINCVKDTYTSIASVLLTAGGGAAGGGVDGVMELPWHRKLKGGFGSKEKVQSLGNTIYKRFRSHGNARVRAFAEWARTAGTGTKIPGLRSGNDIIRRGAKFVRTGGRIARGGAKGGLVVASLIGIYAAYNCSNECSD